MRRWLQLLVGLVLYGVAIALLVRSELGLGPWETLHCAIHEHLGIGIGMASILTGLLVVALTWAAGMRPGPGTVADMVLIGAFADLTLLVLPAAPSWMWGVAWFASGIALVGYATGMYIGAGLGDGPRDGLVIWLATRTGTSVRRARTLTEAVVLLVGWALGGPVGIGTILFPLTIGPVTQWGLARFDALPEASAPSARANSVQLRTGGPEGADPGPTEGRACGG